MEYIQSLRAKVGRDRVLIPATALVILDDNDRVCLHLRNDTNSWGLPGGLMDLGESAAESAIREAREETGLVVRSPILYGVFSGTRFYNQYPSGDQTAPVILGFYSREFSGALKASSESPVVSFFSLGQVPANMNQHHRGFLDGFLEFRRTGQTVAR